MSRLCKYGGNNVTHEQYDLVQQSPIGRKKCHKFKDKWLPLLSIPQLCKTKLTVKFKGEIVKVSDNDGNRLIQDFLTQSRTCL